MVRMSMAIGLGEQMNLVMSALVQELRRVVEGTIFVHIRDNNIGKFGIKHDTRVMFDENKMHIGAKNGLTEKQISIIRDIVHRVLEQKSGWTHGEIEFHFSLREERFRVYTSVESNYNMSVYFPKK
jgi:hypothetical protein